MMLPEKWSKFLDVAEGGRWTFKSELFGEDISAVDRIVDECVQKHGITPALTDMMSRLQCLDVRSYVRFSVFTTAAIAGDHAIDWLDNAKVKRAAFRHRADQISQLLSLCGSILKSIDAEMLSQSFLDVNIPDVAVVSAQFQRRVPLAKIASVIESIEIQRPILEAEAERLLALARHRSDVLATDFIESLAHIWCLLTGKFPPAASSGKFVEFADAAWSAVGWEEVGDRISLGRRIKNTAIAENWSYLDPRKRRSGPA